MTNPAVIICPVATWTKVATDVKTGQVWRKEAEPAYFVMHKDTGDAAPTTLDDSVVAFSQSENMVIAATAGIDVYIYAAGAAGSVRVDL